MCLRRDVCLRHVLDSREGSTAKQCAFLFKRTDSPPPYTKTTAVAVVFWCTRGESEGAKRRNSVTKMLASKVKRQPGGFDCEAVCVFIKTHGLPRIQKQPQLRLFFGVPGGSRTLDTRRRRPVLYPTELRIRL